MKALSLKPGTKNVHLTNVPEPKIQSPHQVKVKVIEVGICGTDREEVSGGRADAPKGDSELIIGHEMLGEVVELGKSVDTVRIGDPVVITVRRGCGICEPCLKGCADMCETGKYVERGIKERHGYDAEMVVEEEEFIVKVPKAIKHIAVLTEPTTVVEKAISEAARLQVARLPTKLKPDAWLKGKKVLVAGLGPIGLLASMILRLRGAAVFGLDIVDPKSLRPQILNAMGGTYVHTAHIDPVSFSKTYPQIDMIVEAAGIACLDFDLIQLLGYNGIYVLTGVPGEQKPLSINGSAIMRQLVLKNQVIFGSVNAGKEDFERAVKDLAKADKKWKGVIEKMITSRTPYTDFEKALFNHAPNEIKAVLKWSA
jgi:glucose 1-dehydrogenase